MVVAAIRQLLTASGQALALGALLNMLGSAPDLDATFKNLADRDAARNFMDLADKQGDL